MAKEDGLILYELWDLNKVMIEFILVMFALVWLELTYLWLPSKWLAVEFSVIYACIYVSKYKPWECVADPNLPYLTLVVLVHVAWCELEDQIAILSTTNYWAIPMSWVCLLCHGSGSLRFKAFDRAILSMSSMHCHGSRNLRFKGRKRTCGRTYVLPSVS
jgi:hypothetical protein